MLARTSKFPQLNQYRFHSHQSPVFPVTYDGTHVVCVPVVHMWYTCTYMYVHVCAHTCCHLYTRHASTHICAHFQWANHALGEIILPSRITNRCSTHPTTLVLQPGPFQRRHQDCPATTDTLLCVGRRNQSH